VRVLWLLLRKDLSCELRTRALASSMLIFALVVVVVLSLVLQPGEARSDAGRVTAAAYLWLAFFFAAVLGLSRSFAQEAELGAWRGLLLTPVPRETLYLGKVASGGLFVLAMEVVVFPIFLVLYQPVSPEASLPWLTAGLALTAALATVGLVAVGVLFTVLASGTGAREALLAGLVLPVVSPALLAAVRVTAEVCGGSGWSDLWRWWALLAGFDLIFLALGGLLFQFAVEE
jgi:heme exporter protein B